MLEAGRSRVRFPLKLLQFFNSLDPSSLNMALRFTRPLTEMIIRKCLASKARPESKDDKLTIISVLIA
jgi:hypothetical protein